MGTRQPYQHECRRGRGVISWVRSESAVDEGREIHEAVRAAPPVVVPTDDLDLVADDLGQLGVEGAGNGIGLDILAGERLAGVDEDSAVSGFPDDLVDLLDAGLAGGLKGEVSGGTDGGGNV